MLLGLYRTHCNVVTILVAGCFVCHIRNLGKLGAKASDAVRSARYSRYAGILAPPEPGHTTQNRCLLSDEDNFDVLIFIAY